ncbi:MAG: hypothetical protein IPL61_05565 [Myxococcales bacterium]|nr:hypothetical protein [Myxococcales bacterium]
MTALVPPRRSRARRAACWLTGLGVGLGRGPRALVAAAFLLIALMYGCNKDMGGDPKTPRGDGVYRPVLARGDGHLMFLMARSLAYDGDLRFENDLGRFGDPFRPPEGWTSRPTIPHPIGPPLVWVPLLWTAQGTAVVANQLGAGIELHGYTLWHQRIVFASSALAAMIAIGLGVLLARRLLGGRWGPAYAGAAILLGTSITYYATFMPSYSHALDAAGAAGFLTAWALTLGRWDRRRVLLLGGLLGVAALMRTQELGLGVVVAFEVALTLLAAPPEGAPPWQWRARVVGSAALMALVALIVLIPQAAAWNDMFGKWTSLPQGATFTRPGHPMVLELLFASRNGWLSTHPLAYAGALGLVVLAWRGPRVHAQARVVALGLLAALALQVYLNSIILDWWAQASFGQRRLCSMTMPLVVGLATWLHLGATLVRRLRWPRALAHGAVVVGVGWFVWWNLALVWPLHGGRPAQYGTGPSCCRRVPRPLRTIATPVYRAVGNPFALPATAWFAWRHDVPLQTWDRVVGAYPWVPGLEYTRATLHGQAETWRIGSPRQDEFAIHGFAPGQAAFGGVRWTIAPRATFLVPNIIPEPLVVSLWLKPNLAPGAATKAVIVRWNGRVVADRSLEQATNLTWTIAGDVGINELTIEAAIDPPSAEATAYAATGPVGVAVGELRFTGE